MTSAESNDAASRGVDVVAAIHAVAATMTRSGETNRSARPRRPTAR